jgi:hypothetical protein
VGVRLRLRYRDEGRFGKTSTPRRCWGPRGMRPDLPCQIVREYTYAFVALSPHDGVMDSLILPQVSEEAMSLFMREVSERHSDEFIFMVMDGAGWHKAKALKVPENMALVFLPPYSPQLNSVGHIWDSIRGNHFGYEVFNSIEGGRESVDLVPGGPRTGSSIGGNYDRVPMDHWHQCERNLLS